MEGKKLDFFLDNPELRARHDRATPNEEMYRFFPPENEIISIDNSDRNNIYRYIFNGQKKTEFEEKKLAKFHEFESKEGKIDYPPFWLESDTMRLLQASDFDAKKTYTTIKENIAWLNSIPNSIDDKTITLLNSGFMYVHGRDYHFRPIIVVSIKQVKIVLSENYNFQDLNKSIFYLMNYIIKYLLIPGQIENWIVFVDFEDVGISDLGDFKKILSTLSKHRGRVFKNYFININGIKKFSVKTALKMFPSVAKKCVILSSDELNKVQEIINRENIEKKYGGLAPDVIPGENNLFPPIMPSSNFTLPDKKITIVDVNAYKEMCLNSNPYKPYTICPKYEEIWKKEKEKEIEEKKVNENAIKTSGKSQKKTSKNNKVVNTELVNQDIQILEEFALDDKLGDDKLGLSNGINRTNTKVEINDFLKEFEGMNSLESLEQRKFSIPTPININDIHLFFDEVKQNQIFFKFE